MRRLPRSMSAFDYKIPESLELTRGQLVTIPLRGKTVWGIVKRLKDRPERGIQLKEVDGLNEAVKLREEELSFFEFLAHDLAQSVSSILNMALPTPPKRVGSGKDDVAWQSKPITLPRSETESLSRILRGMRERNEVFLHVPDLKRMTAILAAYRTSEPDEKILVIVPTVPMATLLTKRLNDYHPVVVTGSESNNQRFKRWMRFRSNPTGLMIGTKIAALLVDSAVTTIFVLNSSDRNHKQWDRNPRFDVRRVATAQHRRFSTNLFFQDPSPRAEELLQFSDVNRLHWGRTIDTGIVDTNAEQPSSLHPSISLTTERVIMETLESGQRLLCVLNKKGVASQLFCRECSYKFPCPECKTGMTLMDQVMRCNRCHKSQRAPTRCPVCNGTDIKRIGLGTEGLAALLEQEYPRATVVSLTKESEREIEPHDILVTTDTYIQNHFDPFAQKPYGLVLMVDADQPLYRSEVRSTERALGSLNVWRSVAHAARARFMIQTSEIDLFKQMLADPDSVIEQEMTVRKSYDLPPFRRWISVLYRDEEPRRAQAAIHQMIQSVNHLEGVKAQRLEQVRDGVKVKLSIELDKIDPLLSFFTGLSDAYIIDTDVI